MGERHERALAEALRAGTISTHKGPDGPIITIEFGPEDYEARDSVFDFLVIAASRDQGRAS